MKRAFVAPVATAVGTALCVLLLAGCGGAARMHSTGTGGSGSVAGVGNAGAPATGGNQAADQNTVPTADPSGMAQLDQNLSGIQQQLAGVDSEITKGNQSPQDGDGN